MGQAAHKIEPQGEWLSESAIAKKVGLHRQTVATRLEDLGYEPDEARSGPKQKIYWFDDEMEFAIKSAKDTLTAAKIRDTRATYQLKELKLAEARKDLVPVAEVVDDVQGLFGAMHKEIAVRMPKELSAKLAKAKTSAQVSKILKVAVDRRFKTLRDDFEKYLK